MLQRLSPLDIDGAQLGQSQPVITPTKKKDEKKGFLTSGSKTRIRKALMKFSFLPRNVHRLVKKDVDHIYMY